MAERLHNIWGSCQHIAIQPLPSPHGETYQAPRSNALPQSALLPQRQTHQPWWTASFSSLTRGLEAGTPHEEALLDADTETVMDAPSAAPTALPSISPATASAWQTFPAGARYGTLLHDLLQYQAEHAWPLANADSTEQDFAWQQLLQRKADWLQLPSDAQALLQPWLQTIVSTPLPLQAADAPMQPLGSPLVLQTLAANTLWAEMEFSLPVGQLSSSELDAHIQRHVLPDLELWPSATRCSMCCTPSLCTACSNRAYPTTTTSNTWVGRSTCFCAASTRPALGCIACDHRGP
ncbi:MAG: hypothetical protein EBT28_09795 [Betaproteobacteria bacterium]|nr:hypothetical protein [Betaproteobacteria bacterium]